MQITNAHRIDGLSIEAYHSPDTGALTASAIVKARRSMAHLKAHLEWERTPATPAMAFGSAFHTLVLEPEEFEKRFAVEDDFPNRRTKGYQEWKYNVLGEGLEIVRWEDMATLNTMRDAIINHPVAGAMFAQDRGRINESSFFGEADGVLIASRPDALILDDRVILDLKTTVDASEAAFQRSAQNFGYAVQLSMMQDLVAAVHGGKPKDWVSIIVAIEKDPPFAVALYTIDKEFLDMGRYEYKGVVARVRECRETGVWPGYDVAVNSLAAPAWAL